MGGVGGVLHITGGVAAVIVEEEVALPARIDGGGWVAAEGFAAGAA